MTKDNPSKILSNQIYKFYKKYNFKIEDFPIV